MECRPLELYKGSTKTYEIQFKKDGLTTDITGWTVYFTAKENAKDLDSAAKIKVTATLSDATNGIALIVLSTINTNQTAGNYYYSIDYKDADDNVGILFQGKLRILNPILNTKY